MTGTWHAVATDNFKAAGEAKTCGRWRTCVSRAYYSAYSTIASGLARHGITHREGRMGPEHNQVPALVKKLVPRELGSAVSDLIISLRRLRERADYHPEDDIDLLEANTAISLLRKLRTMIQ